MLGPGGVGKCWSWHGLEGVGKCWDSLETLRLGWFGSV